MTEYFTIYINRVLDTISSIYAPCSIRVFLNDEKRYLYNKSNLSLVSPHFKKDININDNILLEIESDKYISKASEELIKMAFRELETLYREKNEIKMSYMHDSNVDVLNRNAYEAYKKTLDDKETYSIAFIDANGLGYINNAYGHQRGDEMLRTVAFVLKQNFRKEDIYRVGGDEFIVICENINPQTFEEKIQNSSNEMKETEYSFCSGVAHKSSSEQTIEMLENIAETKMRINKESFRKENPNLYYDKYKVSLKKIINKGSQKKR